jgi:FtsZ-binding cell division protein ZapB
MGSIPGKEIRQEGRSEVKVYALVDYLASEMASYTVAVFATYELADYRRTRLLETMPGEDLRIDVYDVIDNSVDEIVIVKAVETETEISRLRRENEELMSKVTELRALRNRLERELSQLKDRLLTK